MSDEYIRKADVINIPLPDKSERNYITYNHDDTYEQGYQEALDKAASLPPADVVPVVHAHWKDNKNGTVSCSRCSTWFQKEREPYLRFCGYCGAKMDAQGEE